MNRYGTITPGTTRLTASRWQIEENGVTRRYETYVCDSASLFSVMPSRGAEHPIYPGLTVKRLAPRDLPAGLTEYELEYSGVGGGQETLTDEAPDLPAPVYSLTRSQSQEPITTHPNWSSIVAAAGSANVIYDDDGIFKGIGKDADDASLVGVTDYLSFGAVFSVSYVSQNRPSLSGVGTIDSPPAQAPAVGAGYNWLKVDASYTEEGFYYSVNESWMLSARGGWQSDIYGS
jgi:hypothetical protein